MDATDTVTYKLQIRNHNDWPHVSAHSQPVSPVRGEANLESFAEPAFLIDLDLAQVTEANALGAALLGGALRPGTPLDRAMPALWALSGLSTEEQTRRLLLWMQGGAVELNCRCRALSSTGRVVLIRVGADASAAPAAGLKPSSDPEQAMLAHELRTPVSAIMSLAEIMKDESLGRMGNPRYLAYAVDIYETARHALGVLEAMLDTSREAGGEAELEVVVESCVSALQRLAAQAEVRLQADIGAGRHRLSVDRRQLTQILLNLMSNALRFTPPGGAIVVGTKREPDGALALTVADTGGGMTNREIGPSTNASGQERDRGTEEGLGFGLPLVSALARANGARLEISTARTGGTQATVIFPAGRVVSDTPEPR